MTDELPAYARLISEAMERQEITRHFLAKRTDVSVNTIRNTVLGAHRPSPENLTKKHSGSTSPISRSVVQRDEGSRKPAPQALCQASGRASHRRKETNQMHLEHTSREERRAAAMIAHPAGKGVPVSDEVWDRETDEVLAVLREHTPEPEPAVELVPMRRVVGEGFVLAGLILLMCFAEPILGGLA